MPTSSSQPSKAEQSDKPDSTAVLAALKHRVIQSRQQRARAKPEDVTSTDVLGQSQQQNQPGSDGLGPVQTKTSSFAQAQPTPGLSHQMLDDRGIQVGTSRPKRPSDLNAPDHMNANDSVQTPRDITESLMEHLLSSIPSETAGKDTNDAMTAANEVRSNVNTPSGTNGHAATKVQEKADQVAPSRTQRGDDSTARKETQSTKSTVVPKEKSNTQSSIEEGEIIGRPPAPSCRIPVKESTARPASCKKIPRTRAPTVTSIVPTETGAERQVSRSLEATRAPRHREARADTAPANSYTSRSDRKHEHGRASLPARQGRQNDDNHITWETYKAPPPSSRKVYARPSHELPHRPASPVTPRPTKARDWEMQRSDYQDPDLRDWLRFTGWNNPDFRKRELARLRRLEEIEHEGAELRKQGEREKARLKEECGGASQASRIGDAGPRPPPRRAGDAEPAGYGMLGRYMVTSGVKRERGEDSDGDADGGFSAKYHRPNHNYRGSRAGYHGYHHRAREDEREWPAREGN